MNEGTGKNIDVRRLNHTDLAVGIAINRQVVTAIFGGTQALSKSIGVRKHCFPTWGEYITGKNAALIAYVAGKRGYNISSAIVDLDGAGELI